MWLLGSVINHGDWSAFNASHILHNFLSKCPPIVMTITFAAVVTMQHVTPQYGGYVSSIVVCHLKLPCPNALWTAFLLSSKTAEERVARLHMHCPPTAEYRLKDLPRNMQQ